ncbi:pantoate-beta-alanine ligase [Kickxella alabastrina]|uniref:Pantoate-beta-alanine ligase n=1 Tax=Kickxella alabastrina TaxID=61397 RepID=A0ACC1IVC7_9FUNG|nr:pantoate-beta-alanine ligase [Kickxella alabastrina]
MSSFSTPTVQVFHTVAELRHWRASQSAQNKTIGFVPTMGALHAGHLTLISSAQKATNTVVVSIFVNPAQFAPHEDLDQYPRTLAQDIAKLPANTVVFAPSVAEMYPRGITTERSKQQGTFIEVLGLSEMQEGGSRPNFFRGVATVVSKLFHIVGPTVAFFGQKDVQQCCVIRAMAEDLHFPVDVRVVPTVRDSVDGLALSSRNVYLTEEQRRRAPAFYRGLCAARSMCLDAGVGGREELLAAVRAEAEREGLDVEYISLSSPRDLSELQEIGSDGAILSGAWRMGTTRLIDNILIGFEF